MCYSVATSKHRKEKEWQGMSERKIRRWAVKEAKDSIEKG